MRGFKNQIRDLKVKCPNCKSKDMVKAGKGQAKHFKIKQRYYCKSCRSFTVNPIML